MAHHKIVTIYVYYLCIIKIKLDFLLNTPYNLSYIWSNVRIWGI